VNEIRNIKQQKDATCTMKKKMFIIEIHLHSFLQESNWTDISTNFDQNLNNKQSLSTY